MGWMEVVSSELTPHGASRRLLHRQAKNEEAHRSIKRKRKPLGWGAMTPFATCPRLESNFPEAKSCEL